MDFAGFGGVVGNGGGVIVTFGAVGTGGVVGNGGVVIVTFGAVGTGGVVGNGGVVGIAVGVVFAKTIAGCTCRNRSVIVENIAMYRLSVFISFMFKIIGFTFSLLSFTFHFFVGRVLYRSASKAPLPNKYLCQKAVKEQPKSIEVKGCCYIVSTNVSDSVYISSIINSVV